MLRVSQSIMVGARFAMSKISIKSSKSSYDIYLFEGPLELSVNFDAVVVDDQVDLPESLMRLPILKLKVSESNKTLATVERICSFLLEHNCNRAAKILAVGGGHIQDVATLAASLFMRGIEWSYAPTTLIGMADSCIGGKSSINISEAKNVVGNFYPPREIFISTDFLETLNRDTLKSGLLESSKILYARSEEEFKKFLLMRASMGVGSAAEWRDLIQSTLEAKKWFVEVDEFDKNERQLLNFGHTFGHALEAATGYRIQHGIAVGYGMLAAIEFSGLQAVHSVSLLEEYSLRVLSDVTNATTLTEDQVNWSEFAKGILNDKKNTADLIYLILPKDDGGLEKIAVPKTSENLDKIVRAMKISIRKVSTLEVL